MGEKRAYDRFEARFREASCDLKAPPVVLKPPPGIVGCAQLSTPMRSYGARADQAHSRAAEMVDWSRK